MTGTEHMGWEDWIIVLPFIVILAIFAIQIGRGLIEWLISWF